MHDDELMDRLLKQTMAAEQPRLSPAFDARVMRGVLPRRLTTSGRAIMAAYGAATTAGTAWLMLDLQIGTIAIGLAISVAIAAGASAYVRRLVAG